MQFLKNRAILRLQFTNFTFIRLTFWGRVLQIKEWHTLTHSRRIILCMGLNHEQSECGANERGIHIPFSTNPPWLRLNFRGPLLSKQPLLFLEKWEKQSNSSFYLYVQMSTENKITPQKPVAKNIFDWSDDHFYLTSQHLKGRTLIAQNTHNASWLSSLWKHYRPI